MTDGSETFFAGLVGLLFVAAGIHGVVRPAQAWRLQYFFTRVMFRDPEPSRAGLVLTRIGGIVSILIGLAWIGLLVWLRYR